MKRPNAADFLDTLEAPTARLVRALLAAADSGGLAVYAVGGPVRDLLLARPVRDVDLVVEGEGVDQLAAAVPLDTHVTRHDRFGTVLLRAGDASVDIASARRERYAQPGALPRVERGTLEEDLRRRDFSVNALALPLSRAARAARSGIIDFEDGVADLEQGRLRVLHRHSFHDDPTRALRAARLTPRLGFSLTRGSRSALRDALRDGAFGRVSGDRLRREFVKAIEDARSGVDPSRPLRLLDDWHVLGALEPGLRLAREAVAPLRRLGRAIETPLWSGGQWRPWVSAMALWLAPLEPALRRRALRRFSVRGDAVERISRFPKSCEAWLKALARARGRGAIDSVLAVLGEDELHALHASAEPTMRRRIARYATEDRVRRIPLGGQDLVELGLGGPALGRALQRIRIACLDGAVANREEALALAREIARRRATRGKGSGRGKRTGRGDRSTARHRQSAACPPPGDRA